MIRLPVLILGLAVIAAALPAMAQPPAGNLTPDQARAAIQVLNDPRQRAALIATLDAVAKAHPAPAEKPDAHPVPPPGETAPAIAALPLAPNSLGAQVLVGARNFLDRTSARTVEAMDAAQSLPLLWGWVVVMATNPMARGMLVDIAWRLALALLCAVAVEYALRRATRRPIAVLEGFAPTATDAPDDAEEPPPEVLPEPPPAPPVARAEAGETEPPLPSRRRPTAWALLRRVPLVLARLVLDFIPVLGFLLVGHLVAGTSLGGTSSSRLVLLAVVDAAALCSALLAVARMLLSPGAPRLRLFAVPNSLATYGMRWVRRIVIIAVFGYAAAEVGVLLGLSDVAHDALLKVDGLAVHVCLAIVVLQKRRAVQRWLRASSEAGGAVARVRAGLATVWHWIALFVIAAVWLVWAIEVPHGFSALLRFSLVTAALLIGARLALILLIGLIDRAMNVPLSDYPGLEARLRLYHPAISALLRVVIYVLTALGLLQVYQLGGFSWLAQTDLGRRMVSGLGTLAVTIILAIVVWEAVNAAIQRHLDRLAREQQAVRSARLRTLLPLLRTSLLITILVVAGLMVLSEIGINIAPLLAGAGIVGVAIGFGSQKLVQDLITGIFLLLENAMQVGDNVTVSGLSGTVENLSVRTIRLRAGDGSVHIIPFSSVTSVTNVNRGLGNASVTVCVEFDEDTDRVCEELKAIVAGMRAEPDFASKMLGDLQLWGVDKLDGSQVTVAGQVVCTDSGRWSVQREFNRRMKMRFQELGIRLFNPTRTIALPPPPGRAVEANAQEKADEQSRAAD